MTAPRLITDNLDLWTAAVTPKASNGRGNNGQPELTGIKKLRELILELAVRGKLVPQNPTDEPATALLKKIAAEKARLVKEGKIKKPKPLPPVGEGERPFVVPEGWEWVRLGEVTNYGITEKVEPGEVAPDTWVLELEDIEKESSRLLQKVFQRDRQFKSAKNKFYQGDVLYGKLRPYLDKVLVADASGVCTTEIMPIRSFTGLQQEYLRLSLKTPNFKNYATNSTHGMNLPRLGTEKARHAALPLPPVQEKHRIVEKVDELMALCDRLEQQTSDQLAAHETLVETLLDTLTRSADATELAANWTRLQTHFDTLFTTESSIDRLKQTILQLAVMGRLVPQDPNDEPASVLLKKIAAEKARLVKEGKIKKPKPLPEIADEEKPFDLPDGWEWCRFGEIANHTEAGWSPKCDDVPKSVKEWGVLKVSAVTWGEFLSDENKRLPLHFEPRQKYEVKPNDFLISRANTAELVARSVVVPKDAPEQLIMSDKIIRIVFSSLVFPRYINLFNASPVARAYYAKVAGGTSSSMKNVSREQIQALCVPLPPYFEQLRIVQKMDEVVHLCDQLKAHLGRASQTRQQFAKAV